MLIRFETMSINLSNGENIHPFYVHPCAPGKYKKFNFSITLMSTSGEGMLFRYQSNSRIGRESYNIHRVLVY
jgi:hypothetical protein